MGEEKFQRLLTHIPMDREDVDPEEPDGLFISNMVRRVWATLFVQSGQDMVRVQGTAAGGLNVNDDAAQATLVLILAALAAGIDVDDADTQVLLDAIKTAVEAELSVEAVAQIPDIGESFEGTLAADVWTGYTAFTAESRVITCFCESNPCWFQFADAVTGYSTVFFLPADTGRSMNFRAGSFRVKNYTGGSNAKWQVINDYVAP